MAAEGTLSPRIWSERIERGAKVVPYWCSLGFLIHGGVVVTSSVPRTLQRKSLPGLLPLLIRPTTGKRAGNIKPHKSSAGAFLHPSLQPAGKRPLCRNGSLQQHKPSEREMHVARCH